MCRNKKWVKIITIKKLSDIASSTWKETKPLMILKPDMPDVSASSVKLEEVEVNTDAYKAQLVQQKAKRVEAAEALLSKANQDPKAVKKTHTKNARGRGRGGRGRGRGKTPNQDDQEPSATTADDEHKEGMGDEHVDEKPGEGDEGNSVPENNGEGGEADGKKKYKRKTFTNDELDVMWKDRVSRYGWRLFHTRTYNMGYKTLQELAVLKINIIQYQNRLIYIYILVVYRIIIVPMFPFLLKQDL